MVSVSVASLSAFVESDTNFVLADVRDFLHCESEDVYNAMPKRLALSPVLFQDHMPQRLFQTWRFDLSSAAEDCDSAAINGQDFERSSPRR